MLILRFVVSMFTVGAIVFAAGMVYGQEFPNKPIRIIVAAPGGGSDIAARMVAQGIAGPLGQQVIVDYRGGGVLSAEYASKSPPDGYTLHVTGSQLWIIPLLQKAPYDAERDFSPVTLLSTEPSVLAVHPSLPVKSVTELIALAKSRPAELNYASTGPGASSNLVPELFKAMAEIKVIHVPYKSNPAAVTALVSGEVQLVMLDASVLMPQIKAGRVRGLAVTSAQPSALAPGLPTVAASGLPGYEWLGRTGLWAPGKTPAAIVNRINAEVVRFLNLPETKEKFLAAGTETVGNSPEQFAATIKAQIATLGKVIKDAGIKVN